ncbi:MAG: hypothetical protein AB7I59_12710 [Geminicoccaceae bacterium]
MPATPSLAQSEASRLNGASSAGPVTEAGKARSALNSVRHGLSGRTFFLLPDENPEEFAAHEAELLATYRPRDHAEREAVLALVRAMWREIRGDRLEAQVLGDVFAAGKIADQAQREAARAAAFRQLSTVLRYQARIGREVMALQTRLHDLLRQRRPGAQPPVRDEPEPTLPANDAHVQDEPERRLNRQQRRALAAMARKRAA